MAERYQKLYTLPEDLYAPSAPVIIAAGALLKDNQTGNILAQLKIQNITYKEIKAATVKLNVFDTANRALDIDTQYQYLDLKAGRDSYFGTNTPVKISDTSARSYTVAVTEVVFADNTIWSGNNTPWEKQINLIPLSEKLIEPELVKQYGINLDLSTNAKYIPQEQGNLWICACGAINHKEEVACHICNNNLEKLQNTLLDTKKLEEDKTIRITQEQKEAEENANRKAIAEKEQAIKSKKRKRMAIFTAAFITIFFIIVNVFFIDHSPLARMKRQLNLPAEDCNIELFLRNGEIYGRWLGFESTEGRVHKSDEPGFLYYWEEPYDDERWYLAKGYYSHFEKYGRTWYREWDIDYRGEDYYYKEY